MKIESVIKKYEDLATGELDPKLKEIYRMVVHDLRNLHAIVSMKEQLADRLIQLHKPNDT